MLNFKYLVKDNLINLINSDIRRIKSKNLTYLPQGALYNIYKSIKLIEKNNIPGIFVETGCALGGSTILIGLTKSNTRKLNVYDVFDMIPPPSDADGPDVQERYQDIKEGKSKGIKVDLYYGYEKNLLEKVKQNLNDFGLLNCNINLIKGLYEDTLLLNEPVAFAHIDCDWYSSVMLSLKQIEPNLSNGGVMIIDDYYNWSGCKKAVDEYFYDKRKKDSYRFQVKNRKLIITKNN